MFLYVHYLEPRSRDSLDLQYSHIFIYSIRCLCLKIGQGHSRVIIYTNYDGQECPMLHTKFRRNVPAGSVEEDFLRFLPYMGMTAILVM